ncbi:MAG: AAA family ATPase [Gemmatimonadota bacterium]|nr:AAA family ATPase [Gemmatimonadota bacterium]
MRVAIAGKGGTGKTTISGTLARILARRGRQVLAVDADTTPNLAVTLGIPRVQAQEMMDLPRNMMERQQQSDGTMKAIFTADSEEIISAYSASGPDGVQLLVMGKVDHAGVGCLCGAHAAVRGLIGELVRKDDKDRDVIVDMEAGLEHLSRGTGRHLSRFVATIEPYYRSMEIARRVVGLANELGIGEVIAVANKVRDEGDHKAIADFCAAHSLNLVGEIPFDSTVLEAERAGKTPIDFDANSPAVRAIEKLADTLTASAS